MVSGFAVFSVVSGLVIVGLGVTVVLDISDVTETIIVDNYCIGKIIVDNYFIETIIIVNSPENRPRRGLRERKKKRDNEYIYE